MLDGIKWKGVWTVEKFHENETDPAFLSGTAVPYETVEFENVLLLTGINELWRLVTGASANTFTQANTQIGIGDSSTAAANSQTDLQASTNKTYVTSDVSGGVVTGGGGGTTQTLVVKATFGSGSANYAWNELVIRQVTSSICLNRAVSAVGTKASGTWVATCTITLT